MTKQLIILGVSDICVSFGADTILDKVSFSIQEGEKVGIVGVNGAGKTILFRTINRLLQADDGEVYIAKDKKTGYLEQNTGLISEKTIFEEMSHAFPYLLKAEARLSLLEKQLSCDKPSSKEHLRHVQEYTELTEKFRQEGGYEYKGRIKSTLKAMHFEQEDFDRKIDTLSGGQKTRLALVKLLLSEPDILMLDEPTNHLDLSAVEWLEEHLKAYKKTLLLISHDRYFLDRVTQKTIEIENGKCKVYPCSYTEYVKRKEQDRKIDEKHYLNQQKEIARLEAFIENQRRWNRERNIIAAESRMKALERMEKVEKPAAIPNKVAFVFRSGEHKLLSNQILEVTNLTKNYPGKKLFNNLSFTLKSTDRLFVFGANGIGKSTLLKVLSGKIPADGGNYEYAKGIKIGYYDQEQQGLDPKNTILDELWNCYPDKTQGEIRGVLARFLFSADDVFKTIGVLSGGEKARVTFAKLMLDEINMLILDEPTNHLDINSREVLEEAIDGYDGTVIAVSHDRYLVNRLATRILEMREDECFDFHGGYEDLVSYKKRILSDEKQNFTENQTNSDTKNDYLRAKQERSEKRKLERKITEIEKQISNRETRLIEIEKEMSENPSDYEKATELFDECEEINSMLEENYALWEQLTAKNESDFLLE